MSTLRRASGGLAFVKFADESILTLATVPMGRFPTRIHLPTALSLELRCGAEIFGWVLDFLAVLLCVCGCGAGILAEFWISWLSCCVWHQPSLRSPKQVV